MVFDSEGFATMTGVPGVFDAGDVQDHFTVTPSPVQALAASPPSAFWSSKKGDWAPWVGFFESYCEPFVLAITCMTNAP
jgi:hypothetical protein